MHAGPRCGGGKGGLHRTMVGQSPTNESVPAFPQISGRHLTVLGVVQAQAYVQVATMAVVFQQMNLIKIILLIV